MSKPVTQVSLLLLSGGVGSRSRHSEPKQFYELHGHPMMAHSIIPAVREPRFAEIVVNAPEGYEDRTEALMRAYSGGKPYQVVPAGETRQGSSRLLAEAARHDTVILHEAARPFVDVAMYAALIDHPATNAGYCHPISFSMCKIDVKTRKVLKGVSRDKVFDIQLPQKFDRETLLEAHKVATKRGKAYNEDSVMVAKEARAEVIALDGNARNIKVTTPEDFIIAEQMFQRVPGGRR